MKSLTMAIVICCSTTLLAEPGVGGGLLGTGSNQLRIDPQIRIELKSRSRLGSRLRRIRESMTLGSGKKSGPGDQDRPAHGDR